MYDTLHSAIFSAWADGADLSKVRVLLDAGHDVNGYDDDGNTPLHAAALVGAAADRSEAATRLLLKHGADPTRLDASGDRAPLHIAVCGIAEGTVRALLEGDTPPDLPSGNGATATHHALSELRRSASRGSFDQPDTAAGTAAAFVTAHLQALAEHGADFNRSTPGGTEPLAVAACIDGCPDAIFDALLDGGADPKGVTLTVNEEPMDLLAACLVSELSPHVAARMVDAGVPWDVPYALFGDRPFLHVALQFHPDIALALAKLRPAFAQALVELRVANGLNALALAALSGDAPLMEWLGEQGLRPDEAAADGRTPLDIARQHQPSAVAVLERLTQA